MLVFLWGLSMELLAEPAALSIQAIEKSAIQKPAPRSRSHSPHKRIVGNIDYFDLTIDKPLAVDAHASIQLLHPKISKQLIHSGQ